MVCPTCWRGRPQRHSWLLAIMTRTAIHVCRQTRSSVCSFLLHTELGKVAPLYGRVEPDLSEIAEPLPRAAAD